MTNLFTFVLGEYHQLQLTLSDVFHLSPVRLQLSDVIIPARFLRRQFGFQLQHCDAGSMTEAAVNDLRELMTDIVIQQMIPVACSSCYTINNSNVCVEFTGQ